MKKTLSILFVAALLASCHKPEYVLPTADRQGITSLTAYFAFGPFEGQEMGRVEIADPTVERYEIPVPWYFPESSDDITTPYMTKVRVRASLQPNCKIEPGLTVLDLTDENHFTYTDATGASRDIIITGKRVKSSKCDIITFALTQPVMSGMVDKVSKKVSLITPKDLSVATASVTLSAHATISPDPALPHNYNDAGEGIGSVAVLLCLGHLLCLHIAVLECKADLCILICSCLRAELRLQIQQNLAAD